MTRKTLAVALPLASPAAQAAEPAASLIEAAVRSHGLDPARMTCLGYSNGADLLAATLRLHPGTSLRRRIPTPRGTGSRSDGGPGISSA